MSFESESKYEEFLTDIDPTILVLKHLRISPYNSSECPTIRFLVTVI